MYKCQLLTYIISLNLYHNFMWEDCGTTWKMRELSHGKWSNLPRAPQLQGQSQDSHQDGPTLKLLLFPDAVPHARVPSYNFSQVQPARSSTRVFWGSALHQPLCTLSHPVLSFLDNLVSCQPEGSAQSPCPSLHATHRTRGQSGGSGEKDVPRRDVRPKGLHGWLICCVIFNRYFWLGRPVCKAVRVCGEDLRVILDPFLTLPPQIQLISQLLRNWFRCSVDPESV